MAALLIVLTFGFVDPPQGFTALFNGNDLTGWKPAKTADPRKGELQVDEASFKHWKVENGEIVNDGHGAYLTTDKHFGDVEFFIDYKTVPKADSGIYLRATPQVQIWDRNEADPNNLGKKLGSGGLWNNSKGAKGKDPLTAADKPLGEWNTFRIRQIGARTTVYLNDQLVVDDAHMENYWDKERKIPLIAKGPIQLQTHGGEIRWRNIFYREIGAEEANKLLRERDEDSFANIFNENSGFTGWAGAIDSYEVKDGAIVCKAGKGGVLHTSGEYADFAVRLEFKLPKGGNNGLAIRYPGEGDTAYTGMCELQILDDSDPKYSRLDPRQAHGSAYGMAAAARGYLRPVGEWNYQEVTVKGSTIKVELNGTKILDTDLSKVTEYLGGKPHPGKDRKSGYFGFAGHSDPVMFRNVAIKQL
jgi:hypothetical protein